MFPPLVGKMQARQSQSQHTESLLVWQHRRTQYIDFLCGKWAFWKHFCTIRKTSSRSSSLVRAFVHIRGLQVPEKWGQSYTNKYTVSCGSIGQHSTSIFSVENGLFGNIFAPFERARRDLHSWGGHLCPSGASKCPKNGFKVSFSRPTLGEGDMPSWSSGGIGGYSKMGNSKIFTLGRSALFAGHCVAVQASIQNHF